VNVERARRRQLQVGCSERRRDKESGEWVDGRHLSVSVTRWRTLAESVLASLSKGDPVIVTGEDVRRRRRGRRPILSLYLSLRHRRWDRI
jgi:single-stranded DNA-binding protein